MRPILPQTGNTNLNTQPNLAMSLYPDQQNSYRNNNKLMDNNRTGNQNINLSSINLKENDDKLEETIKKQIPNNDNTVFNSNMSQQLNFPKPLQYNNSINNKNIMNKNNFEYENQTIKKPISDMKIHSLSSNNVQNYNLNQSNKFVNPVQNNCYLDNNSYPQNLNNTVQNYIPINNNSNYNYS